MAALWIRTYCFLAFDFNMEFLGDDIQVFLDVVSRSEEQCDRIDRFFAGLLIACVYLVRRVSDKLNARSLPLIEVIAKHTVSVCVDKRLELALIISELMQLTFRRVENPALAVVCEFEFQVFSDGGIMNQDAMRLEVSKLLNIQQYEEEPTQIRVFLIHWPSWVFQDQFNLFLARCQKTIDDISIDQVARALIDLAELVLDEFQRYEVIGRVPVNPLFKNCVIIVKDILNGEYRFDGCVFDNLLRFCLRTSDG